MPYSPNYPATLAEVLDPPVVFRPSLLQAVKRFAQAKPYRGDLEERKAKFLALHNDLCNIYGKQTRLVFGMIDGSDSGSSHYCPANDEITLCGKLSVVTALHEFAHALGRLRRRQHAGILAALKHAPNRRREIAQKREVSGTLSARRNHGTTLPAEKCAVFG